MSPPRRLVDVPPFKCIVIDERHNGCVPVRVEVNPEPLIWARGRSGLAEAELTRRFPKLAEWELGERLPTLKQLEGFAQATHTPIGFLLLSEPPVERVPIPDYRTMGDLGVRSPAPISSTRSTNANSARSGIGSSPC